uniref:Uncharacterized protein n=1 Tax=Panagrolaimus superbus TaxID=310955 RepID=A0A914Z3Q8_9BILA
MNSLNYVGCLNSNIISGGSLFDIRLKELVDNLLKTTTPASDSNGQNHATKLIGIIIFGWIFAFWNLL